MKDYLNPDISSMLHEISVQGLAHVGDAVFELMVRTCLCMDGTRAANKLHDKTVSYVSAKAQASAAKALLPLLTEDELIVFKRGRNAHANNIPKSSTTDEYHSATGIETLFGYLYLSGNTARLNELFSFVIQESPV